MGNGAGQSDVDRVRDATDLVDLIGNHIALQRRGREFVGLCPFHDDHDPSFAVVTHKGNAFYKCHACGAAGDAFNFVMDYHRMDFPAALKFLADRAGITLAPRRSHSSDDDRAKERSSDLRARLLLANKRAASFFRRSLQDPQAEAARATIQARRISDESSEAFQLGAALPGWDHLLQRIQQHNVDLNDFYQAGLLKQRNNLEGYYDTFRNRLMFPICDELGRPIAFGGRKIDPEDEPKYLNSPESPLFDKSSTLYALHLAKRSIIDANQAIVTEGYTDVIACHQAGFTNVIATLGTALTEQHAKLLRRLCDTVTLIFDGDEAGQKAADRAVEVFFTSDVDVQICVLPDGSDPDDLLQSDQGPQRFAQAIEQATDALSFKLQRLQGELNAAGDSLSGRQNVIERFFQELGRLGFGKLPGLRRRLVLNSISDMIHVPAEELDRIARRFNRPARVSGPAPQAEQQATVTPPAPTDTTDNLQQGRAVSPQRQRAERHLLSLLLAEPEQIDALLDLVQEPDQPGGTTTLRELLAADFADPLAAMIADQLRRTGAAGGQQAGLAQAVMQQMDQREARDLVASLFMQGCAYVEQSSSSPVELVQEAAAGLLRTVVREEYEQSLADARRQSAQPADQTTNMADLLERRRRQGYVTTAIPRVRQ